MTPRADFPAEAVIYVGDGGINALATARSLGRRGVPVQVVALQGSPQIASLSRYCATQTRIRDLGALYEALRGLKVHPARPPLLFIDNDKMMKTVAPYAAELQRRFRVVEPLAQAVQFTDKTFQLRAAAEAGIAVPRTWLPGSGRTWRPLPAKQTGGCSRNRHRFDFRPARRCRRSRPSSPRARAS